MQRLSAEDAPVDDQEGFWFRLVGGCRLHGTVPSALQDAPGSSRLVVCARRYSLVIFSDLRGWCRWARWINQITVCCISHRSTCCILFSDGHYKLQRLLCCAAVVCCAFGWPAMVPCPSYFEGTDIQPKSRGFARALQGPSMACIHFIRRVRCPDGKAHPMCDQGH
jgi:hypothetical protein